MGIEAGNSAIKVGLAVGLVRAGVDAVPAALLGGAVKGAALDDILSGHAISPQR